MRILAIALSFVLCLAAASYAVEKPLLIDDFEGVMVGGPEGTIDFGAGGGSSVEVASAMDIKNSGSQSIKVTYTAVPDGYMWIARGFELDVKNAGWLVKPSDINWAKYSAISFYMYGSDSKANIAFDIKDNGNEIWRIMIQDKFKGWKKITCVFGDFFARGDWQPNSADKNATLDFPLKSFQFEPRPEASGVLYFDTVELVSK